MYCETLRAHCGGAPAVHSAGYASGTTEDPANKDLTRVHNSVDWYWNNSAVFSATCGVSYWWFSTDGWYLDNHDLSCTYNSAQTKVDSSDYARFINGAFCFTIDTHVYYNRQHVWGTADGTLIGEFNWSADGGCSGALSFAHELHRTLN